METWSSSTSLSWWSSSSWSWSTCWAPLPIDSTVRSSPSKARIKLHAALLSWSLWWCQWWSSWCQNHHDVNVDKINHHDHDDGGDDHDHDMSMWLISTDNITARFMKVFKERLKRSFLRNVSEGKQSQDNYFKTRKNIKKDWK